MTSKTFDYQAKTEELERLIAALEDGELDIDQALKAYETARKLLGELEDYLKTAENKVSKISKR